MSLKDKTTGLDLLPSGFCCKEAEKSAKNHENPELRGLKLKHMPAHCIECKKLFWACQLYAPSGNHNNPTCKKCLK